jgi:hypothetical protein
LRGLISILYSRHGDCKLLQCVKNHGTSNFLVLMQTYAAMNTFVLAMTLFPNKQTIAQDELDRVVGHSRLPTMEDRASLPYVDAIIKETLRWNVLLPTSIPRRTEKDDIYKGTHRPPILRGH